MWTALNRKRCSSWRIAGRTRCRWWKRGPAWLFEEVDDDACCFDFVGDTMGSRGRYGSSSFSRCVGLSVSGLRKAACWRNPGMSRFLFSGCRTCFKSEGDRSRSPRKTVASRVRRSGRWWSVNVLHHLSSTSKSQRRQIFLSLKYKPQFKSSACSHAGICRHRRQGSMSLASTRSSFWHCLRYSKQSCVADYSLRESTET